jgi:xylulokinase
MTGAFLGIDIGTSGLKLLVVDPSGAVLARASAGYGSSSPRDGWAEQDPRDWIDALGRGLGAIDEGVRQQIVAIGAVGHVPTLVLVGQDGAALRPAITWQDSRAVTETALLEGALGAVRGDVGTELPWSPTQLIPKLSWISEHERQLRARTRWVLQPKDYLNLHLTGVASTDPWSSKGLLDVRDGTPADRVIAAAGWSAGIVPPSRAPWEPLAALEPGVARDLGLDPDVLVATGWTDALGAVLAVGAFDSPRGFILTGTSNIVGVSLAAPAETDGLYAVPAGPAAPLPLLYGPTQSGGEALQWAARLLGVEVPELIGLAATAGTGEPGPTFVPYLRGERAPIWNPGLRALFAGLGVPHGRPEFARSVVDGVAFSARHVLELSSPAGAADPMPVETGGLGTEDPRWGRMWARALGRTLRIHAEPSLSALGAAMLGARATGWQPDEISRLRQAGAEHRPDDPGAADADYADYLTASRIAQEWSSRDRVGH